MDDPQNYSSNLPAVNGAIQSIDMFRSNYYFLLAKGPLATDSSLAYHTIKLSSGTSVNLTQAGVNAEADEEDITFFKIHGCLMILAWMACAPSGIFLAHYYRKTWVRNS
jgi:hypothetical protein